MSKCDISQNLEDNPSTATPNRWVTSRGIYYLADDQQRSGQSRAEHDDGSIMFHGQGTRTTVGEPCSVPSRRNRGWLCNYGPIRGEPKIRSCHFRFCNCSTLISLSRQADRLLPLRNLFQSEIARQRSTSLSPFGQIFHPPNRPFRSPTSIVK